jgi:hypothetical protein
MLNSSLLHMFLGIFLSGTAPGCRPVQAEMKATPLAELPASSAQPDTLPALQALEHAAYPFIAFAENRIEQSAVLKPFFQRLQELENRKTHQVRVLHIGDSHIQADFFTGWLRYLLQKRFGEAGRGLVFPYRQAGSQNPCQRQLPRAQKYFSANPHPPRRLRHGPTDR